MFIKPPLHEIKIKNQPSKVEINWWMACHKLLCYLLLSLKKVFELLMWSDEQSHEKNHLSPKNRRINCVVTSFCNEVFWCPKWFACGEPKKTELKLEKRRKYCDAMWKWTKVSEKLYSKRTEWVSNKMKVHLHLKAFFIKHKHLPCGWLVVCLL